MVASPKAPPASLGPRGGGAPATSGVRLRSKDNITVIVCVVNNLVLIMLRLMLGGSSVSPPHPILIQRARYLLTVTAAGLEQEGGAGCPPASVSPSVKRREGALLAG